MNEILLNTNNIYTKQKVEELKLQIFHERLFTFR